VLKRKDSIMAETYNGYCVKCKDKRDFDGEVVETNGRRMAKGTCPVCGTKMNRILGKG
jgi:Zn finger protein HypA/HybF involved in hydrogenase expression